MEDDIFYDGMPDDPGGAFVYLVKKFRTEFEKSASDTDQGQVILELKQNYYSNVIAAAKSLDIPGIKAYELPRSDNEIWKFGRDFDLDVNSIVIQFNIARKNDRKKYSVALTGAEEAKARHYVDQLKELVENSTCTSEKREVLLSKLNELLAEIDRDRTRFEVITDKIRSLSTLSGDIEREGANPWYKWVALFFGVVDNSKEEETRAFPVPTRTGRIEAPRKSLPSPTVQKDLDDEVPF